MNVQLTPRSEALIAQEQSVHGAISPEQLIEKALEAYTASEPSWFRAHVEQRQHLVTQGLQDLSQGRLHSAEDALDDLDRIVAG